MDIQTAVIGGLTFVACAAILIVISKFGMKEKSYEEALAEQRKRTTALLGTHKSAKPKEKKLKKSTKKVKEKHSSAATETETPESNEDTDSPAASSVHTHHKLHVEFKEPAIIEESVVEESMPNVLLKKEDPPKTDLIKEKLHASKHNVVETSAKEQKPNRNSNNSSDIENKENKNKQVGHSKEKNNKEKHNTAVDEPQKNKKQPKIEAVSHTDSAEEIVLDIPAAVTSQANGYVSSAAKEKKKKKNDINLHHLTGSKDADVNLTLLLNAVRKAELSRSEVQILIDLLLNKQHEAPETLDEWSEGKTDPIQKLKRQLAEKEKALVEEQEALGGAQAKLREIRSEQTAERAQLQQRSRGLEEALQAKHLEMQAINGRLLSQNQKIQQMQAKLNEEAILLRNLREENTGLQLQRQQVDIHLSQAQEAEATIQDLQSRNNQLAIELHTLTEQNMAAKEHQQNVIVQLQHQVNHFKGELDEKESINRQLDDLRRDLEHRLGMGHRIENELKHEISQLKSVCQQHAEEVRRLEHGKGQALEEARNLQKQKEDLDHAVAQHKLELRDLQGEISELRELRANGLDQENKTHKAEMMKLQHELSATKSEVTDIEKQMSAMRENHDSALAEYKESLIRLHIDIDEQKNKNNELSRIRTEEQQTNIKFIQRLFPNMDVSKNLGYEEWMQSAEEYIDNYVKSLETPVVEENKSEIVKLQAQLQHYKAIIDDTEAVLTKLQAHIEQEEILWRNEMKKKDLEVEMVKKQYSSEISTKVQHLELQLTVEREAKQKLSEQYEQMKTSQSSAISANSAIIEKLSEELKQLSQELSAEKSRSAELLQSSVGVKDGGSKLDSSSSNGPFLEQEVTK